MHFWMQKYFVSGKMKAGWNKNKEWVTHRNQISFGVD
jgi:hypothetical protein